MTTNEDTSPVQRLMHLLDGFVTTQLLYVMAVLRIDEVLADGPATGSQAAAAVGVDSGVLTRVLRGLAAEGVVDEDAYGRFSLTDLGAALGSVRGAALVRGDLYFRSAGSMLDVARHGGIAFDRTYGQSFFDHLADHPEHAAAFEASMAGRSMQEVQDIAAAYDFAELQTVIDVGGGPGILLSHDLASEPRPPGRAHRPAVGDRHRPAPVHRGRVG